MRVTFKRQKRVLQGRGRPSFPSIPPCRRSTSNSNEKKWSGPPLQVQGGAQLPEQLRQPHPARNIFAKCSESGRFRRCYEGFRFRRARRPVAPHYPSAELTRLPVSRPRNSPPGDMGAAVNRIARKKGLSHPCVGKSRRRTHAPPPNGRKLRSAESPFM